LALTAAAVAGAARADGPLRVILAFVAAVLALPAVSLACMIGLALLLQRGEHDQADSD
jgi:hypothetical protein